MKQTIKKPRKSKKFNKLAKSLDGLLFSQHKKMVMVPQVIVPSMCANTAMCDVSVDREIHQKKMNFVCNDIASLFKKSCPEPAISSETLIDDSEFDFCNASDDKICEPQKNPLKRLFSVNLKEVQNIRSNLRNTSRFVEEIETKVSKCNAFEFALQEVTKRRKYFHPVEVASDCELSDV